MDKYSISFACTSKSALGHNRRDDDIIDAELENGKCTVDKSKTKNGAFMKQERFQGLSREELIKKCYTEFFGTSLEDYNKSVRKCRRKTIDEYIADIRSQEKKRPNTTNLVYEAIVQIGNKDHQPSVEQFVAFLKQYMKHWTTDNKNMKVVGLYIHNDEAGGIHAHISYVPVGHNCKRGMKTANNLSQALDEMGFKTTDIHHTSQMAWNKSERDKIVEIAKSIGLACEWTSPTVKKKHKSTENYALDQENERLKAENTELKVENADLKEERSLLNNQLKYLKDEYDKTKAEEKKLLEELGRNEDYGQFFDFTR